MSPSRSRRSRSSPSRLVNDDAFSGPASKYKSPNASKSPARKASPASPKKSPVNKSPPRKASPKKGFLSKASSKLSAVKGRVTFGGKPLMSMIDTLGVAAAIAAFVHGLEGANLMPKITTNSFTAAASSQEWLTLAVVIVLTQPILYAYVWTKPKDFAQACKQAPLKFAGGHAVDVFAVLVPIAKLGQQAAVLQWAGVPLTKSGVQSVVSLIAGNTIALAMLLLGQALNYATFKAIGKAGVYYGSKLGKAVPWSSKFPYNTGLMHPQYVGNLASQLAVLLALGSSATVGAGLVPLAVLWTGCYMACMVLEGM